MAPSQRVLHAYSAMRVLGIAEKKVKPVLKKLLKVYDKNWELIEAENYRALADAIFEADKEEETNRQHQNNERQNQNTSEEVQEEPKRPLKRLRLRNQEGQNVAVLDSPDKSLRAERMSGSTGQSVLNSEVGGASWSAFLSCQDEAYQEQIDQMTTEDLFATMADNHMKAIQVQINIADRVERLLSEIGSKNDQLEQWEKRYDEKVVELETVSTSHAVVLEELNIERKRNAELELAFQKLKLENEAEKRFREADKAKAEVCLRKIMEELDIYNGK